jgi:hypothetical protein
VSVVPSSAVSTRLPPATNWPLMSEPKKLPPKALTPLLKFWNTIGDERRLVDSQWSVPPPAPYRPPAA